MSLFISSEVLKQIYKQEKIIEDLKVDIQLCNQKFKNKPGCGNDANGPMSRTLTALEDVQFFFDQFMKCHGLKNLDVENKEDLKD